MLEHILYYYLKSSSSVINSPGNNLGIGRNASKISYAYHILGLLDGSLTSVD